MKKIGILTYHCVPNFGAQLQALSTVGYLRHNGYEPIVIDWYPHDLETYYQNRAPECQIKLQMEFAQEMMPLSSRCRTIEDVHDVILQNNIDYVFLGSDALFDYCPERDRYNFSLHKLRKVPIKIISNHDLPNPFWASYNDLFEKPIPTVGFSISSQNSPYNRYNQREKRELGRLLHYFKAISVRDEWTQKLVYSLRKDIEVPITPDPVFAFNQNNDVVISKEKILKKFGLPDEYVLVSFIYPLLSDAWVNETIRLIESELNAACVSFPMPDKLRKFDTKYTIELPLSPLDWYYLIKYSSGYVGERMHPIVVCLHNSVPFFCFDQYGMKKTIIPRLWYKFVPGSSKIYDIVNRAEMTSNICFYSQLEGVTPDNIVSRLMCFDKDKCDEFSQLMEQKYNGSMKSMLYCL